jgi:hypothetical protein
MDVGTSVVETRDSLIAQTVKQLQTLAKQRGFTGYSKLRKLNLIEHILTHSASTKVTHPPGEPADPGSAEPVAGPSRGRGERQKHGFEYEIILQGRYIGWIKLGYTAKFDLRTHHGRAVSAKTYKQKGELCLADYDRNKNVNEDFVLCVRQYRIDGGVTQSVERFYHVDHRVWKRFFTFEHDAAMTTEWGLITNLRVDDARSTACQNKYKNLWGRDRLVQLRFKRDHKKQKRIQCAVPNARIEKFLSHFTPVDSAFVASW